MKNTISARTYIAILVCIFAFLVSTGCSKVTKENYNKISIGMKYNEVVNILGKPDKCEENVLKTKSCIWGSPEKGIKVSFVGGIVTWHSSKGI